MNEPNDVLIKVRNEAVNPDEIKEILGDKYVVKITAGGVVISTGKKEEKDER